MNTNNLTDVPQKKYFYWLDTLRFLAAFMVVFSHSRNDFFLPYGKLPVDEQGITTTIFYFLGRLGHEAVVVFFILSGFLVGGVNLERIYNKTFTLKNYIIDRGVRIYLPLIASVLLFFITCMLIGEHFDIICALGNLLNLQETFVDNLVTPYWSLAYEMWFYIMLAAYALIITRSQYRVWGFLIMVVVGIMFVSGLHFFYMFLWWLGAFAYLTKPQKKNVVTLITSIVVFMVSVILCQVLSDSDSVKISIGFTNKELTELLMAGSVCVIIQQVILFPPKTSFGKKVEAFFSKMAKFSYTLYLSHRIIFLLLFYFVFSKGTHGMTANSILKYTAFVTITIIGCFCLYLVSERHTYKLKKYIKARTK